MATNIAPERREASKASNEEGGESMPEPDNLSNGDGIIKNHSRPLTLRPGVRSRLVDMGTAGRPELNGKEVFLLSRSETDDNRDESEVPWTVRMTDGSGIILEVAPANLQVRGAGVARQSTAGAGAHGLSSFIESEEEDDPLQGASRCRRVCREVLSSSFVETGVSCVIFLNFVLICLETDSQAEAPGKTIEAPNRWVSLLEDMCFLTYVVELSARIFVEQCKIFKNYRNILDMVIIIMGLVEYLVQWIGESMGAVGILRIVRLGRLLRLLRVMKLFSTLKELQRLLQMMGSCSKTLFWSVLLLLLVMTIWAIISVELINPRVQELAHRGAWSDCDRCQRAFSSTFMAGLTIFQTVVAGDSWGMMAVPVIENYPETAIVFIGALMTLVFGVLNLIVAVIVDSFAEARENDVASRAETMASNEVEEKSTLASIFQKIDEDGSGSLSFEELEEGARKVREFRNWLRVMDIDKGDLRQLFQMVDVDNSGEIDLEEFIEAMFRIKNTESKTATRFVKHLVTKLETEAMDMRADLTLSLSALTSTMERAERAVRMLDPQKQVMDKALNDKNARSLQFMELLDKSLQEQEIAIQATVALAMTKASEVALQAAMAAAAQAAKDVMSDVSSQSKQLADGMISRLHFARSSTRSEAFSEAGDSPNAFNFAHESRHEIDVAPLASCGRLFPKGRTMRAQPDLQASGGGLEFIFEEEGR
eukprot:CAMPEP_0203870358 /NCGR_PEP_ID=MMETSP0359-20131031/18191_1 /ASSEMBLY_ACC=CAM_ASM_000338 /TAXON_ID=268821 /ORGANISM="Scrippsiella Hangoei, Strain SHTV-5" /LENGTH=707 /DNA_ID=CAMNT_0050789021 /DNA_START=47 /DNA_END=2170 /DNA_ORIENTATION=-